MTVITEAQLAVRKAPKAPVHKAKVALRHMENRLAGLPKRHARELAEQTAKVEAQHKLIKKLET